jgi:hypothetical protein
MRGISVGVGIILVQTGAALAAPGITQPACGALEAWGAHVNADAYNVAPRLTLPKAFEDTQVVPLFGLGVLAWTPEDLQAANQLLTKCYGEAGKRRDGAAAGALANANRALQGLVPRTNAALQKAKADAEPLKQQIAGLPDTPELDRGLATLLKVNPAQPDITPFRALPQGIADPLWRLASQVLPVLENGERETLFKSLGERRAAIQSGMASTAESTIASAPADADGMIQLIGVMPRVAALYDTAARTRLAQSASDRLKQINDTLRQAKPPVWVPPSCIDLYRWSSSNNATAGIPVGGRNVLNGLGLDAGGDHMAIGREHGPGDFGTLTSRRCSTAASHARLLLVIEGESEQVAKGRERALHRVRFGLFERVLVGFAQGSPSPVANPAALPANDAVASAHSDPHARRIGAGPGIPSAILPDALAPDDFAIPPIEAENAVLRRSRSRRLDWRQLPEISSTPVRGALAFWRRS